MNKNALFLLFFFFYSFLNHQDNYQITDLLAKLSDLSILFNNTSIMLDSLMNTLQRGLYNSVQNTVINTF